MYGRLIVIFLGLALFINSCNNLLSQLAGTYKLRTLDIKQAIASGIEDAEYIQIDNVCPGPELHTWEGARKWKDGIAYFALGPCAQAAVQSSQQSDFQYIGWAYLPKDSMATYYPGLPVGPLNVKGLVRKPPRPARGLVNQQFDKTNGRLIFLRLDTKPVHWGWFLAGMLLPVLVIGWMENRSYNRKKKV